MTNINLARDYMLKALTRLEVLEIYLKKDDYSDVIREAQEIIEIQDQLPEIAEISKWLRRERELAFYGDTDFIPSEEYTEEDALRALQGAKRVVEVAKRVVII